MNCKGEEPITFEVLKGLEPELEQLEAIAVADPTLKRLDRMKLWRGLLLPDIRYRVGWFRPKGRGGDPRLFSAETYEVAYRYLYEICFRERYGRW